MSSCLHGRLFGSAESQVGLAPVNTISSFSPGYLTGVGDFPFVRQSRHVDDESRHPAIRRDRTVTLTMLSARKPQTSGGIGISDEVVKTWGLDGKSDGFVIV